MSDEQAQRMVTLLTALLGGVENLLATAERIETGLAQTGQQLAQLMDDEYHPSLANTQAQGGA